MYADILLNIASLDKTFQYLVPPEFAQDIGIGTAVRVPLGKGKTLREGYVVGLSSTPKVETELIRPIAEIATGKVPAESRLIRLAGWMRHTYGSTMQHALAATLPVKDKRKRKAPETVPVDLRETICAEPEEPLSEEQQQILAQIRNEWAGADRPVLLHGVTGSGKTRIYCELVEQTLEQGRQAIVLIPEIALSRQTVHRFRRRFGETVSVLHSRMSKGERFDQFVRMQKGEARIVIGPRSALFAPFPAPGLIIVDEEQEPAYRSESAPRYDSREVALFRGREEGAHVLFGSATPSIDSYYRAKQGRYALLTMPHRFGQAELPTVQIVDMKEERKNGNLSLISRPLEEAIRARLESGEQVMLFLNRRGFSGVHTCQSCGHVLTCRHCNISLTLHTNGRLVCHYCGYQEPLPSACPTCGSVHIRGFRYGTQKVENDIHRLFPQARTLRMDADTTRRKGEHSEILRRFAAGEAEILIGTQMIVKGHDFPRVTLVGVLAADLSLFANEYRAQERTYQLLVQAVGRSGRADRPGEALIQTEHPEHDCIRQAIRQDYESFYENEILTRELAGYPPAEHLLAIHASSEDEAQLDKAMQALRGYLQRELEVPEEALIGPAPETVSRRKDVYLAVLYVRSESDEELTRIRRMAEKYIAINSGFRTVHFAYDRDA